MAMDQENVTIDYPITGYKVRIIEHSITNITHPAKNVTRPTYVLLLLYTIKWKSAKNGKKQIILNWPQLLLHG